MEKTYKPNYSCQIANIVEVYTTIFKGVKIGGSFIEIGAYDGVTWSNTDFLARDLDWQGIYVEPMPEPVKSCGVNHAKNDITVIQKAVSDHNGIEKLYLSTGISHTVEPKVAGMGDPFRDASEKFSGSYLEVECITLEQLFEDSWNIYGMTCVDLLVIDIEGAEEKILRSFNISKFMPTVVIVEVNQHVGDIQFTDIYFKDAGYEKFQYDGLNAIYYAKDIK
jgi:FkbM family methyltransferase